MKGNNLTHKVSRIKKTQYFLSFTFLKYTIHLYNLGAQDVLAERDEGISRGRAARSGQKRPPQAVDMGKQIGRADNEVSGANNTTEGAQALLDELDGQAGARMYDNPELTAPILRNPKDISRRGDGGGARDWSKLPGRELNEGAATDGLLSEEFGGQEELDLAPKHDAASKYVLLNYLINDIITTLYLYIS